MKIPKTTSSPYFKLTSQQDLILFLIYKELLCTRFTNTLNEVGFDDTFFNLNLGTAILSLVGFTKRSDELWQWYYTILDKYAAKVDVHQADTARELTLDFYTELRQKLLVES